MLSKLKVVHRILLIAIMATLGMIAIAISGYSGMNTAMRALDDVYKDRVVPLRDIREIADRYAVDIVDVTHKTHNGNITYADALEQIRKAEDRINRLWQAYLQTNLTPKEATITEEIKKLRTVGDASIAQLQRILGNNDGEALAAYAAQDLYPAIEPLSNKFGELVDLQIEVAKEEYEASLVATERATAINLAVLIIASLLGFAISIIIARQISRELGDEPSEVANLVSLIAAGQLNHVITVRPGMENSILSSMKKMCSSLCDIITRIRQSAEVLAANSDTMASNGEQVMQRAATQSQSTTSIAAAVEEMSVGVTTISDNATTTRRNSLASSEAVNHGLEVVQNTIHEMEQITANTSRTAEDVKQLADRSSQISKIVNVIKEIADQTNLLALNAAIEAARAGETGRGFAVVADEVRKLSERTTQSTSEITATIEAILESTQRTLKSTETSKEQVQKGMALANETGSSMSEVKEQLDLSLSSIAQITDALAEQSSASQMIGQDVERIANMTEENSGAITSLNDAAGHIKTLANDLYKLVQHFKL
ncbi:methyl-accepting chemotaxis protein [Betaproteobacteria bacterium]|nr:methyl-accepting chemotaxis protein [Betaproteobacteria bacterium]GHU24854.1 methyl-accepting chemotaxis protein [Betaproteobacteria bacterium]GHU28233.1 methyl-accepting chemotaxis protein [Betaproteobacteria bacterium]